MNKEEIARILKSKTILFDIQIDDIREIIDSAKVSQYHPMQNIITRGELDNRLCIILSGEVEVYVYKKNNEVTIIETLKQGDHLGEIALLVDSVRSASVRCKKRCEVCWIEKSTFEKYLNKYPVLCRKLLTLICKRLASTLHIISEKKTTFVLINYTNNNLNLVEYFETYFKKISSYAVFKIELGDIDSFIEKHDRDPAKLWCLIRNKNTTFNNTKYPIDFTLNLTEEARIKDNLCYKSAQRQLECQARIIHNKTIGIALASGGAPALAHIGVLTELKSNQIPIDYIVGTSAGALYGSIFAFELEYESLLVKLRKEVKRPMLFTALMNLSINFSAIMKANHLRKMIKPLFENYLLEEAKIPISTVASDLYTGKTVTISQGSVIDAILASNAAPLLVEPFKMGSYLLVDGVATSPLPVKTLMANNIDIKIAVNIPQLDLAVQMKENPKLFSIYLRTRSMMANEMVNSTAQLADIVIEPAVKSSKLMDWQNMEKYIEAGRQAAQSTCDQINSLLYQSNKSRVR